MHILAISSKHPQAHDGCIASIEDGRLMFSIEAEKDSGERFYGLSEDLVLRGLKHVRQLPDVLVQGEWDDYINLDVGAPAEFEFFKKTRSWRTSHERGHIFCGYGLSPFPQGQPCYMLLWEGTLGSFYKIDADMKIERLGTPMWHPGHRYQALWSLARADIGWWYDAPDRLTGEQLNRVFLQLGGKMIEEPEGPGKVMALAAYADAARDTDPAVTRLIDALIGFAPDGSWEFETPRGSERAAALFEGWEPFRGRGVEDQGFKNLARRISDTIYDTFYRFAKSNLPERLPLIIAGGCGLNCTWNTRWKECGLFEDLFVPPCTNDSGIAIGSAIDAQYVFTGNAKVEWSVMAGEAFVQDADLNAQPDFVRQPLDLQKLARLLAASAIVGWTQGRYEMGPRALGHRSIIAAPFDADMLTRLNELKKRDAYRPIAPICLEEDVGEHFHWSGPSPYMLHFQKVRNPRLQAVTHVDGTARVQTVNEQQDPRTWQLLHAFKRETGVGVLCNTSLNFKNRGFINRTSDLLRFAREQRLDAVVIDDEMLIHRNAISRYL